MRGQKPGPSNHQYRHGESSPETPEYNAWTAMIKRCTCPSTGNFSRYGGRGIKVCERWLDYENFLADMGRKPTPEHSLDRIDGSGHYTPLNCRWATPFEQAENRSTTRFVVYQGERMCLSEACRRLGIRETTVGNRISRGWDVERALNTPSREYRRKPK